MKSPPLDEKRTGLARVLSKLGYCSRTEAVALIRDERVTLNGKTVRDPETPVRMGKDRVAVDGAAVKAEEKVYWVLHKPAGLVTTADDERGRETVYSLLPEGLPHMGPVGRLDMASEGLLLMTNDTEWAARITAPQSHLEKTYHVRISGRVDDDFLRAMEDGVTDRGEKLRVKSARRLPEDWIEVVLEEGKNRQIRRIIDALGPEVQRLVRVAIGGLKLGDLPLGKSRPLTVQERKALSLR